MTDSRLAFIGGGNMARSLIGGLIADGWDPGRIRVADPDPQQTERLAQRFSVFTTAERVWLETEKALLAPRQSPRWLVCRRVTMS